MLSTSESSCSWVTRIAMQAMPIAATLDQTSARRCVIICAMKSLIRIFDGKNEMPIVAFQTCQVKNGTEKFRYQRCIAPIGDLASQSVCLELRASPAIVAVRDQSDRTDRFGRTRRRFLFRDERESRRKRKKALRVHENIKQPHAPLDSETLSFVAGEHRVDGGGDLHRVGRVEKHFDEFFATAIPCVHEGEIDVHDVIDSVRVLFEK